MHRQSYVWDDGSFSTSSTFNDTRSVEVVTEVNLQLYTECRTTPGYIHTYIPTIELTHRNEIT